ncbi:hypothetical protein EDC04DRAFT_2915909 [Pisolithus marmoratus]|nr:hypothetical protein EDC04DRAFT_2915909 [Pisolithus marmoratus]
MAPGKVSTNSPLKVGPPVSIRKSKRIKAANLQTKGLMDKECKEQYFDSFQSKAVTLKSGRKMNWPMALQQLYAGVITMEDIADKGGCDQSVPPSMPSDPSAKDTQQMDSEHDEQAVEDAVRDTLEADSHISDMCDHPGATNPHTTVGN